MHYLKYMAQKLNDKLQFFFIAFSRHLTFIVNVKLNCVSHMETK